MAAGCCSAGQGQKAASCLGEVHDHDHDHDHDNDHVHRADCVQESECCADAAPGGFTTTVACCDSEAERCDEECIIAAAAVECEKTCESAAADHEHAHDADGQHPARACSTHLAKAFDQYSAYLESARCICRSILERGWATRCCAQQPEVHRHGPSRRRHHHHVGPDDNDDKDDGIEACHDFFAGKTHGGDVEKAEGLEHVAVLVDGMTCSGCGNKMQRTLAALPGVRASSVRVNFVMGSAEFSLDTAVTTPDEAIRSAERASGFGCTRLAGEDDQTLDLLASGAAAARALADVSVPGVTQSAVVGSKVVRLTYDPAVVGARDLTERLAALSDGLAPPRDDAGVASGRKRLRGQLVKTLMATCFTVPVVVIAWGDRLVDKRTEACVALALATVVQLIAVPDFYHPALSALVRSGSVEMDMLVVISITAAYVYSVVAFGFMMAGRPLETEAFFETSTLLITLVLLGRLIAGVARIRAVEAVSMRSLQAATAVIVDGGTDREVDARLLQYGDRLKIAPHTAVPTDAVVIGGSGEVDESMLTGESEPVFKTAGDSVLAGTINGSGVLLARLTRLPGKNTVTDIARMVEEAANSKPRLQDVADRVAGWFVPVITSVAAVVVVVWVLVGLKVRGYGAAKAVSNAITFAVATLAVSCPCALGLAVPMVLVVAGGIAARNGVVIKSAECTESARKVTDVVLDKTGTMTEGALDVVDETLLAASDGEAIGVCKALVAGNKHPVSLAVAGHLAGRRAPAAELAHVHVWPGAGVEAMLHGAEVRAGSPSWTGTTDRAAVARLRERGLTLLVVTRNAELLAVFGLRARLRAEAVAVVAQLRRRNVAVHLVSGDQKLAVDDAAAQAGIAPELVASQCTPGEKRDYVARLMAQDRRVMFVGDGTNDAVAVTQADVGVQLASPQSASEVTRGAADVVLLNGLEGILFLLRISRVSFRRIAFNFAWSAAYNVLAMLFASGALVKVRIPPAYAGLGEIVSVLPVVFAAMTMLFKSIKTG